MTDAIFDGPAVFARAWYATTKDFVDESTVVRSALQTVFSLLNEEVGRISDHIDRTLFCWDGQHGRDKGRSPKPDQFYAVRESFQEALALLIGTRHTTPPFHEADDAVATAVYASDARRIYVISSDKDLMQLQGRNVYYYDLNQNMVVSQPFILRKFGVKHPSQAAIALAILGDRVDNIQGIKGWGPKKVKALFETVEDGADFQQALDVITGQIPNHLQEAFFTSLDRTLLNPLLTGLPDPAPVKLASIETLLDLGISGAEDSYLRMYRSYTGESAGVPEIAVGMEEQDY